MEAYDHAVLDQSALEIVETAKRTHSEVHGPIPLPTRIERYTVLSGPHIDKKARQQFEIRTHKRLIDIKQATARTIEALNKLSLPAGVDIKIKATSRTSFITPQWVSLVWFGSLAGNHRFGSSTGSFRSLVESGVIGESRKASDYGN